MTHRGKDEGERLSPLPKATQVVGRRKESRRASSSANSPADALGVTTETPDHGVGIFGFDTFSKEFNRHSPAPVACLTPLFAEVNARFRRRLGAALPAT